MEVRNNNYSAENIQILEGLEAVRKGQECILVQPIREGFII